MGLEATRLADAYIARLERRRNHLNERIEAAKARGWDASDDEEERDALSWILGAMKRPTGG